MHRDFAPPEPEFRAEFRETNFGRPNLDPNSCVEFFDSVFPAKDAFQEHVTLEKFTSQKSPSKIHPRNRAKKFTLHLCRAIGLTYFWDIFLLTSWAGVVEIVFTVESVKHTKEAMLARSSGAVSTWIILHVLPSPKFSGESYRPLTPIPLKNIAIHLPKAPSRIVFLYGVRFRSVLLLCGEFTTHSDSLLEKRSKSGQNVVIHYLFSSELSGPLNRDRRHYLSEYPCIVRCLAEGRLSRDTPCHPLPWAAVGQIWGGV